MTDGRCPYCYGVQNSAGACFTMNCPGAFSAIGSQFSNMPHPLAADPRDAELRALRRVAAAAKKAEQVFAAYWADDMDCGKPLPNEEFIEVRKALKEAGL